MRFVKFFFFLISLVTIANGAFATVSLSIKDGEIPKTKILFFGFDSNDPRLRNDSAEVFDRIKRNLRTTDLFEIIKQTGHIDITLSNQNLSASSAPNLSQENLTVESLPNFDKYSKAAIGALLIAQFNYDQNGNLEMRVRMWDVLDQRQLFGKFYTASKDNYRKIANVLSNEIYKAITGENSGHFTSQIVYVAETGAVKKRVKKIAMIDFDGEGQRFLTDGRELVLTPVFSKKQNEIFYLRYFENKAQIYSLDLRNLRSKKVGGFRGTTFAPSINPKDQNLILLSAIVDGNSDIYEFDIEANVAKRLTKNPAIDTTPSYSPDGKWIAFASDRDSGQQIYLMDRDGSSVTRISSGDGSYSKPMWSPDGRSIAFTKIKGGQFFIGVMAPNGKGEKLLTNSFLAEGAKWSPNGRYLIHSKQKGVYGHDSVPRLFVIDVLTGFEFELPTPANEGATDPDWV